MQLRIYTAAIALMALFAVPATQAAAAPLTAELEGDYAAALAWWGVASPPQCAGVTTELLPTDPYRDRDGVTATMRATQPKPGTIVSCHLYVFEDEIAHLSPCIKEVDLRHEVGHLLGYGHSDDSGSIMHAPPVVAVWCPADESAALAQMEHDRVAGERAAVTTEQLQQWVVRAERCRNLPRQPSERWQHCWRMTRYFRAEYERVVKEAP